MDVIRVEIVKLYNVYAIKHLQKQENDLAKYYLDLCDKFPAKDPDCFLITKNNYSCYYSNIGQYRNARNIMTDITKIHIIKVIDEISYQNTDNNNNNDDKNENNKQSSQSIVKKIDYSPIANDYSNLCALNNKVKK